MYPANNKFVSDNCALLKSLNWYIFVPMEISELATIIDKAVNQSGQTGAEISRKALGNKYAVARIFRGHDPASTRLAKICAELGLEFYIGPPRDDAGLNNSPDYSEIAPVLGLPPESSADEILASIAALAERAARAGKDAARWREVREALSTVLQEQATLLQEQAEMREALERAGISDESNVYALERQDEEIEASARPLDIVELAAAAGDGSFVFDEEISGRAWFRRDWLYRRSLEPAHCVIIHVRGESMEPTLPDGCSILVDRTRTRRQDGRIQVLRTDDGIVVKRLAREKDGWLLISDHPAWPPRPWDRDTVPLGEVRWMARSL